MLENPLVLQSHVKTQPGDMTLDTDLDILPIKKRRESLPLKKRTIQTTIDDDLTNKCVENLLHFKEKDESNVKLFHSNGITEKSSTSDIPMDFSLPTRIRALFKKEQQPQITTDCNSFDYFMVSDRKSKDIAQNGIFGLNSSLLNFPLPLSFGSSPMALQTAASLFTSGLPSVNLPFPINFPFNFSPHLIQTPSLTMKTNSVNKVESSEVCKKQKSKQCKELIPNCNLDSSNNSESESSSIVETYVINPATGNRVRRCYKNMTTERRMEANARERTRVHTIGAAFDRLRKLVPSLAPDQKLSKLSILRISCSYIMLLAAMNDLDYSADSQGYTIEECTEMLTETINSEAKFKR